jgi:hypothetical protein
MAGPRGERRRDVGRRADALLCEIDDARAIAPWNDRAYLEAAA